jgi:hypothetical protein
MQESRQWYIIKMIGVAIQIDNPKSRKALMRLMKQYVASTDIITKEIDAVLDATVISMIKFKEI